MICYDRPYISDHFLYDCTTACTVTASTSTSTSIRSSASSISGTGSLAGSSTHTRTVKRIPKRYNIGPVEIHQVEHVKLDVGLEYTTYGMAGTAGTTERSSRDKERERGCAGGEEELLDTDGRRSPIRRKLDKTDKTDKLDKDREKDKDKSSSVISRMLSRTRLRPSVQPPPLIHMTYPSHAGASYHPGAEPKHIHHLQNGKLPSFDESFDVSAYYSGGGRGDAGASMVPEFDTPKRSRASEDGPYLNNFANTARHAQAGPSSPSRKGNSGAGATPHHQHHHRISPSRAHFGTNPKLFPTSSPRAYQYEPLPPLPRSADPNTSISSTRGIKEPPNEPYAYLASAPAGAHRRHHSHDARAGSGGGSGSSPDEGEESDGDVTVNGKTERRRPASIAASTIPLPPSPPHTAIMPSSFVLPAELRRAQNDASGNGEHGHGDGDIKMGSVKRERVPTPIPGDVGVTSVRISPSKSRSTPALGADEHGIKASPSRAVKEDEKADVFSDFDRFFAGFPPPIRAGTALGMTETTTLGGSGGGGSGGGLFPHKDRPQPRQQPHSTQPSSHTYRTADYPISAAVLSERSLPTPPLTNGSSSGSHTGSAYSATGAAGHGDRIEHAIHNLQLVIQTLQATGADQAAALLRQAELEMRLQSMDEELGQVREQNVRLEVQVRREREERRKVIKEAEGREEGWKEKLKLADDATSTAQSSLHHLHLSQTASSTRITSLESDLRQAAERNASLSTHINELESEIVRLGGAFDLVKADYARREEALKKRLAEAEFMHHALKESGARIGRELEACKKRGEELEKRSRGYI